MRTTKQRRARTRTAATTRATSMRMGPQRVAPSALTTKAAGLATPSSTLRLRTTDSTIGATMRSTQMCKPRQAAFSYSRGASKMTTWALRLVNATSGTTAASTICQVYMDPWPAEKFQICPSQRTIMCQGRMGSTRKLKVCLTSMRSGVESWKATKT